LSFLLSALGFPLFSLLFGMDSVTHLALGACVGEVCLSKKLGKKALIWGALAQSFPDIDTFAAFFVPSDKDLIIHRGITHSLFFAIVMGLLFALIASRIHRKQLIPFATLAFFFCGQLMLHDLLDTCNSYGTGLLEPFIHQRFSINLLYVADPLFTIGLVVASLLLVFKKSTNKNRKKWVIIAIVLSIFYLGFACFNKISIDNKAQVSFNKSGIHPVRYFSTPTPLNCMLWYVVAAADSNEYTAYSSVWDNKNRPIIFEKHADNYALLHRPVDKNVLKDLEFFAGNYYTVTQSGNVLYFNIPRFEQIQGWDNKNAPFAFSYPLLPGYNGYMLLQKGRLTGWNKTTVKLYIERIAGAISGPRTKSQESRH